MLAEYIKNKGRLEGRQEGRKEGKLEGRKEGHQKSILSVIHNAWKQGLSVEMIAQITNLEPALIEKILKNEQVDIPPQTLNQEN